MVKAGAKQRGARTPQASPRSRPEAADRQQGLNLPELRTSDRGVGNQSMQHVLAKSPQTADMADLEDRIAAALATPPLPTWSPDDTARQIASDAGGGEPLPPTARADMESRFGYDLGRVRVHPDNQAAAALGAKAVTSGDHIRFRPGRGPADRTLLAHEIAHVVQQATGETSGLRGPAGDAARRSALERHAAHQSQHPTAAPPAAVRPPRPLPSPPSAPAVLQFAFDDDVLRELRRLPSTDVEGLTEAEQTRRTGLVDERRAKLRALFSALTADEARAIHERLKARRRGDPLSERFHDILGTATRRELLGILEGTFGAPPPGGPTAQGQTHGDIQRLDQTIRIGGLPAAQPNYADRSFEGLVSAPVGDDYTLYRKFAGGQGQNGTAIPKREFHLDDDPLGGFVVVFNNVYPSRDVAEAVLAEMRRRPPTPDARFVTYYLRDGVIFPTTLSATTLPVLIDNLRRKRDSDRADIRASRDLSKDVMWWYIGARIPLKITPGVPRVPPVPHTAGGGAAAGTAAFNAARVADGLLAATQAVVNPGQRMLAAARQLSAMRNLTAAQKVDVTLEFFKRIGFWISKAGVVDEGAQFVMYAEKGPHAFRFVKATGEILYGKLNMQTMDYVWQVL